MASLTKRDKDYLLKHLTKIQVEAIEKRRVWEIEYQLRLAKRIRNIV